MAASKPTVWLSKIIDALVFLIYYLRTLTLVSIYIVTETRLTPASRPKQSLQQRNSKFERGPLNVTLDNLSISALPPSPTMFGPCCGMIRPEPAISRHDWFFITKRTSHERIALSTVSGIHHPRRATSPCARLIAWFQAAKQWLTLKTLS